MKDFTEIKLESWKELHELAKPNWIYRGQGDASWAMSTSLERCFIREASSRRPIAVCARSGVTRAFS